MTRLHLLLITAVACLATAAAAMVTLSSAGTADEPVSITLSDGAIEISGEPLPGRQLLETANSGTEEHELVILKTERAADELAVGLHGVSIDLSGELVFGEDHAALGHRHAPRQITGLMPGHSRPFQVDLGAGHYVAYCATASHYLEGEHADFEIERRGS